MNGCKTFSIVAGMIAALSLCGGPVFAQGGDPARPAGWDEASHGNDADPDYAVVFPQDEVNTITITLSPENWQAMLDDMTGLYGAFGSGQGGGAAGPGRPPLGGPPQGGGQQGQGGMQPQPQGGQPNLGQGQRPPGMGAGGPGLGGGLGTTENPIWVEADITFEGQVWTHAGIRFKGNSSLMSTWRGGSYKLPFRLDFDEFEDAYPEIENQRFYGFKELSFSSNWSDPSLLREKVAADIFRAAGVPAPQTAFYAVYVDYGEGPVYFGLYTAVEIVDDTVIETQFDDDGGNVYKPDGAGATFAAGSFDEASFDKETHQAEADYSDILALFEALHAGTRTTDPDAWRSGLEAVFDVEGFVRWLAVNSVIQNWDSYGQMAHNYYLYNDPTTGRLAWIPWDNNEALKAGRGMGGGRGGPAEPSLSQDSVGNDWPLIRYLMDDPVYHALYVADVAETIEGPFAPARMEAIYRTLHDLIAPYVVGAQGEQAGYTLLDSPEAFEASLATLIEHVNQRHAAAQEYINSQRVM